MSQFDNNQGLQGINHDIAVSADEHVKDKDLERSLVQLDNIGRSRYEMSSKSQTSARCGLTVPR